MFTLEINITFNKTTGTAYFINLLLFLDIEHIYK
jgi:hypothetical protein